MSIIIRYASYGVGEQAADVSSLVTRFLQEGRNKFYATNGDFGDPAPGERKYLAIQWENDGEIHQAIVAEHSGEEIIVR